MTDTLSEDAVLCRAADVPEGGALKVERPGRPPLAVFRTGGRFFVTDDTCTHGDASLSEGEIDAEELVVECPWHSGAFALDTGAPCGAPCTLPLRVHRFEVRGDVIVLVA
ncbi:non-heme iron oxygenase ferredoxin subunit [Xanthobacter sp. V4C-4]|uniref:non-heme iron oxygenase ferredoxin subunit n=1 Tax=Xanthobacter cornucopiae TaxID=3119924 RepID=UPI00372BE1DC